MFYSSRISFDGSHFIANEARIVYHRKKVDKTDRDIYFDELYKIAYDKFSVIPGFIYRYIRLNLVKKFGETSDLDEYMEKRLENKERAMYAKKRRFWLKAQLNKFNYHFTQTCDSEKYEDQEAFRKDFKKTMQNLRVRRGWHYIIKWEHGDETNRLHAHALVYIRDKSQMPGIITLKRGYSRRKRRIVSRNENSFFAERYGRNDFSVIAKGVSAISYVGKYLEKTEDNVTYSRGLATYLETDISDTEVIANMQCIKKHDDGTASAFLRFVTYDFVSRGVLQRWYRDDGIELLPRTG